MNAGESVADLSGCLQTHHARWQAREMHADDDDSPNRRSSASDGGRASGAGRRDLKARGMRAAALAINDGALGADVPRLLTHFDFPAAYWKYIPSTKPIEFTFATVTPRRRVTKGAGSRVARLTRAFKLLWAAQGCWRRLDAHDLRPLVQAGGGRAQMDTGWNGQSRAQKGKRERSPPDHLQSTTLDISRRVGVGGHELRLFANVRSARTLTDFPGACYKPAQRLPIG